MARGKHKSQSAGRRAAAQNATIAQLQSELKLEQDALIEADAALEKIARLKADLASERSAITTEVAAYSSGLQEERDYLRAVYGDVRGYHSRIFEAWNRYCDAGIDRAPGRTGLEQVEAFNRSLGLDGWMASPAKNTLSTEQVTRIQRARGERRTVSTLTHEDRWISTLSHLLDLGRIGPPLIQPKLRDRLINHGVVLVNDDGTHTIPDSGSLTEDQILLLEEAADVAKTAWTSKANNFHQSAVLAWGSGPLIVQPMSSGDQLLSLGCNINVTPSTPKSGGLKSVALPLPSTPSSARTVMASYDPTTTLSPWHDVFDMRHRVATNLHLASHPFAPLNPHPQPGQALASQNMFALAGYSRWLATYDDVVGEAAVGLTASASYWLPSGQTASFADSEPMSESDRAEMTLPFPQVFLAFAEPLVLEPVREREPKAMAKWLTLSAVAHDVLRDDVPLDDLVSSVVPINGEGEWPVLDLEQAIAMFGAQVEGLLFLADAFGRPTDRFAWCVAVPGAYGSPVGRFVLPASRSLTRYRDVVDNLTAVVAWAQWHEPDATTQVPLGSTPSEVEAITSTSDFRRDAKRSGAGIRVIDVGSTYRGSTRSRRTAETHEETETHVTPHIRRGHWRTQRFGPGLEQHKRIRIAPVLVNAHRGDLTPRVYRLRSRT